MVVRVHGNCIRIRHTGHTKLTPVVARFKALHAERTSDNICIVTLHVGKYCTAQALHGLNMRGDLVLWRTQSREVIRRHHITCKLLSPREQLTSISLTAGKQRAWMNCCATAPTPFLLTKHSCARRSTTALPLGRRPPWGCCCRTAHGLILRKAALRYARLKFAICLASAGCC